MSDIHGVICIGAGCAGGPNAPGPGPGPGPGPVPPQGPIPPQGIPVNKGNPNGPRWFPGPNGKPIIRNGPNPPNPNPKTNPNPGGPGPGIPGRPNPGPGTGRCQPPFKWLRGKCVIPRPGQRGNKTAAEVRRDYKNPTPPPLPEEKEEKEKEEEKKEEKAKEEAEEKKAPKINLSRPDSIYKQVKKWNNADYFKADKKQIKTLAKQRKKYANCGSATVNGVINHSFLRCQNEQMRLDKQIKKYSEKVSRQRSQIKRSMEKEIPSDVERAIQNHKRKVPTYDKTKEDIMKRYPYPKEPA
jgi:hypothetical protein